MELTNKNDQTLGRMWNLIPFCWKEDESRLCFNLMNFFFGFAFALIRLKIVNFDCITSMI